LKSSSLPLIITSKKVVSPCIVMATTKSHHNVKALVTVKKSDNGLLKNLVTGIVGNNHLVFELVSSEIDPSKFLYISYPKKLKIKKSLHYFYYVDRIFIPPIILLLATN
jgi:hypothetical protein